jgi:hypothetical protein
LQKSAEQTFITAEYPVAEQCRKDISTAEYPAAEQRRADIYTAEYPVAEQGRAEHGSTFISDEYRLQ